MDYFKINRNYQKQRWISFIDLLGFKNLVISNGWDFVFSAYSECLNDLKNHISDDSTHVAWVSDSFIIYSDYNDIDSLELLNMKTILFLDRLLHYDLTFRGSLAYGSFYADEINNIYFGKSFIEAYQFAEHQDWIGFILCPSVVTAMKNQNKSSFKFGRYISTEIPFNKHDCTIDKLPAYLIGDHLRLNGKNIALEKLESLRQTVDSKYRSKYDKTIDFINKNTADRM